MKASRFFLLVTMILVSTPLVAQDFEVIEVNSKGTRARVKKGGDVSEGDTLKFTDQFAEVCRANVVGTSGESAVVDISDCENKGNIKASSVFRKTSERIQKTNPEPVVRDEPRQRRSQGPTEDESWYTLWGLGFAGINYDDQSLNDAFTNADASPGISRSRFSYDLFGFYWPSASRRAMHGFVINTVADTLSTSLDENISIYQYGYSYSFHQFFGANIGDGWFLRGDIGLSRFVATVDTLFDNYSAVSDFGIGVLGGGGYAFAIGEETRMLVGGYLSVRNADDTSATNFSFIAGFLF